MWDPIWRWARVVSQPLSPLHSAQMSLKHDLTAGLFDTNCPLSVYLRETYLRSENGRLGFKLKTFCLLGKLDNYHTASTSKH